MDRISIRDLEIFAHHGVLKEENVLGQKFLISVEMECSTKEAGNLDDIEQTIDYAKVCRQVAECLTKKTYRLIEAVAEQIAEKLLLAYEGQVQQVTVEVKKPWAPVGLSLETVSVCIKRGWHTAYIGLGSNMGDKKKHLDDAVRLFGEDTRTNVVKISSYYETKPVGGPPQDDFLNGVAKIHTLRTPQELLALVADIEKAGKRERTVHWGPRTIDADILLYDKEVVEQVDLYIPHREMAKRKFVLEPLCEIAPYAYHPVSGRYVCDLYEECKKEE